MYEIILWLLGIFGSTLVFYYYFIFLKSINQEKAYEYHDITFSTISALGAYFAPPIANSINLLVVMTIGYLLFATMYSSTPSGKLFITVLLCLISMLSYSNRIESQDYYNLCLHLFVLCNIGEPLHLFLSRPKRINRYAV